MAQTETTSGDPNTRIDGVGLREGVPALDEWWDEVAQVTTTPDGALVAVGPVRQSPSLRANLSAPARMLMVALPIVPKWEHLSLYPDPGYPVSWPGASSLRVAN